MTRRVAPLPVRDGVGPSRLRLHGGNVLAEFTRRFGAGDKVLAGGVVDAEGAVIDGDSVGLPALDEDHPGRGRCHRHPEHDLHAGPPTVDARFIAARAGGVTSGGPGSQRWKLR